jgi:flagellar M-ring protein FliF
MDFLNKAFAQLSELFRSMTPGGRLTAGLLLLVVVISLGCLFTYRVSGPNTDLMNGVPIAAGQLAKMEAAFAKANLSPPEIRGTQILVPRGQKNLYMAALVDGGALPPNIQDVFDKALEETSPFTSAKERAERVKFARQKMLAMIINAMKGIESAYVLYDAETTGGLRKETVSTASANVKPAGSEGLDEEQVRAIRHLVAAAIAGLKPEHVTVTDLNAHRTYAGDSENGGTAADNIYVRLKRTYERDWKARILAALTFVPNVTVVANVVLDPERKSRTTAVKHEPKAVAFREEDETVERELQGAGPSGPPGYRANAANVPQSLPPTRSQGSHETESETKRSVDSVVSSQQTEKETVGLLPQQVSVIVGIPSSYFEKVWKERNPPEEGQEPPSPEPTVLETLRQEETSKIKQYVAGVLPPAEGVTDKTELVTVTTFEDITPDEIPAPTIAENALVWLGRSWKTLGMAGLALFSLVMLRSMIRSGQEVGEAKGAEGAPSTEGGIEGDTEAAQKALKRLGRFSGSGPSLRDELSELVHEDSDVAANILKTWIGHVG